MKPKSTLRSFLCIASSAVLTISYSHAQSGDWTAIVGGNWTTATSWSTNPTIPGTAAGDVIGITGNIAGAANVTINTTPRIVGILNIGDSNNTHGFTINASGGGTLTFNNSGSGAQINEVGSIADAISAPIILGDNLAVSVAGTLTMSSGGITESGGARSITKSGGGTLILSGNNSYSGGFTLSAGSVQVSAGTYTGFGTGTLTINGGQIQTASATTFTTANDSVWNANFNVYRGTTGVSTWNHDGDITLGANVTVNSVNNGWNTIVNGAIGETGGSRNLSLTGNTLSFTLNGVNTYSGSTTIGSGTFTIGGSGSLGSGSYAGAISNATAFVYASSAAQTLSGVISGAGTLTKNTSGSSVLTLSGANTYTGATTVNQGTLKAGIASVATVSGAFGKDSAVTLANNSGVALDLNGFDTRIGSLTGGGTTGGNITNSSGTTAILTQGNLSNATTTFGGIFSGNVGLTKNGTGTFTLTGANNYSGLTTVSDGTVIMTTPSTMGGLTVAANKSFVYRPTTAGALDLGSGALTLSSGTTTNIGTALGGTLSQSAITSSGAASLAGTGKVNIRLISGAAPAVGTHNLITAASGLDGGTYTLGAIYNNTDFTLSNFTRSATAISVDVVAATALSGNVYWKGGLSGNTGVWSASDGGTQSNWQVTDTVNQPLAPGATTDLVFSATTTPGTMAGMTLGANVTIRSLTINNTATAFGLTADGNTLTITPSSSTTGITIGSGVQALSIAAPLILGADQTWTNNSANLFTVSGAINNGGNDLNVAGRTTISSVISGAGGLTKSGSGVLLLTNDGNSYAGPTIVTGGVLALGTAWNGGAQSIPGGIDAAVSGSNLEINGGNVRFAYYFKRTLGSGAGQFQITGGTSGFSQIQSDTYGRLSINNNVNYEVVWGASGEGAATGFFNPSALELNNAAAAPTQVVNFQNKLDLNGATRTVATNSTTAVDAGRIDANNGFMATTGGRITGVIRNSGGTPAGLTKTGIGELQLTAANTYDGNTSISAGTLTLYAGGSIANSPIITVGSSATFDVSTRTSSLSLGSGQTLASSATGTVSTATLKTASTKNLTLSAGGLAFSAYGGANGNSATNAPLTVTGATAGELILNSAPITVTTTTSLAAGDYVLVAKGGSAIVNGTPGTLTVNGSGASGATSLAVTGGQLILTVGSGGDPYTIWSGGALFGADANNDGVSNGLAFLLGAANPSENAIGRLPTVTQSGGDLILNFNCLPTSARGSATLKVEHSSDLGILDAWTATTAVVPDATNAVPDNDVTFVVGAGPVGPPALNSVTATIDSAAAAGGKLFGRLKGEQ